jgi:hypothetical protein
MIFFSYSRADSSFVLDLAERLRAVGIYTWVDQLQIPSGARWDQAVEDALMSSLGLVAVLSPSSVASQNVMDEVSYAIDQRKHVIPILVAPCEVPFRIRRLQHIDFTTNAERAFEQLCNALRDTPGATPRPGGPAAAPIQAPSAGRSALSARFLLLIAIGVGAALTLAVYFQKRQERPDAGNYQNCISGYVWRLATPEDRVCVTMETHLQTLQDNQAAPSRRASGGAYGPDTCVQGYVWREAFAGDRACVTPAARAQAARDNQQATQRIAR